MALFQAQPVPPEMPQAQLAAGSAMQLQVLQIWLAMRQVQSAEVSPVQ